MMRYPMTTRSIRHQLPHLEDGEKLKIVRILAWKEVGGEITVAIA